MSKNTSIHFKGIQRNILLIGPAETASFLCSFRKYWKCIDTPPPESVQPLVRSESKTTVWASTPSSRPPSYPSTPRDVPKAAFRATKNYFTVLDEQFCFIDTPKSMISAEVQYLHEVLKDLKVIDAILVFVDDKLTNIELHMQKFFTATNYPREKVIFIIQYKTPNNNVNFMTTRINLEYKLKEMHMITTLSTNKNIFVDNFNNPNTMLHFCYCLKTSFISQPCVFQFNTDVQILFDTICYINSILIEVLLITTERTAESPLWFKNQINATTDRSTICKYCSIEKGTVIVCHCSCKCLDGNEELQNCKVFNSNICQISPCGCSVEAHVNLKYNITTGSNRNLSFHFERNPILHILATLYLFCKQHSELPDISKNLRKDYWSLAIQSDITSDGPVYQEIEDKIEELESNSYKPTPEEITAILEGLETNRWYSFVMTDIIKTNCELKIIANTNMSLAPSLASTSRGTQQNNQKPVRFPEMKSKSSPRLQSNVTKGEDERDAMLEILRKEVYELKMFINKEKNEEVSMQDQIDDLKQK